MGVPDGVDPGVLLHGELPDDWFWLAWLAAMLPRFPR
jgi:hypothetical protein